MNKIAVLGCGWLGFPLAKELVKNGYIVKGSTTSKEKVDVLLTENIDAYQIDITNINPSFLISFFKVDELIITVPPKGNDYSNNLLKLKPFIEKSPIKRVFYTSSISVYGNVKGIITEDTICKPITERAKQITLVEQQFLQNSNFSTIILRLGGLIGNNRHPAFYVSNKVLKTSNEYINLIHLDDCIAVIKQLLQTSIKTELFNLVSPYHPTKGIYYTQYCEKLGIPSPIINNLAVTKGKKISSTKISTLLNYSFKNNLIHS